jgi:hypothetical protein
VGAALATGVVLLFSGVFLAVPGVLSLAALLYTARRRPTDTSAEAEPAGEMNAGTTRADSEHLATMPRVGRLTRQRSQHQPRAGPTSAAHVFSDSRSRSHPRW